MGIEDLPQKDKKLRHRVLNDIRAAASPKDALWLVDGIYGRGGYDIEFSPLLENLGYESFQELIDETAERTGRKVQVLDLFGGAYFVHDLTKVSKIIGARLGNVDDDLVKMYKIVQDQERRRFLKKILAAKQRKIVEGNLYTKKPWNEIKKEAGSGFDLIVCRPVGHFTEDLTKVEDPTGKMIGEIMVSLLERTLGLLSEKGILISEVPVSVLDSPNSWDEFLNSYVAKKKAEGYKFIFPSTEKPPKTFAVEKQ